MSLCKEMARELTWSLLHSSHIRDKAPFHDESWLNKYEHISSREPYRSDVVSRPSFVLVWSIELLP